MTARTGPGDPRDSLGDFGGVFAHSLLQAAKSGEFSSWKRAAPGQAAELWARDASHEVFLAVHDGAA